MKTLPIPTPVTVVLLSAACIGLYCVKKYKDWKSNERSVSTSPDLPARSFCSEDNGAHIVDSVVQSEPLSNALPVTKTEARTNVDNGCELQPMGPNQGPTERVALDCEMVGCGYKGSKSVLARVTVVNYDGHVLYDTFVLPGEDVTDYRTFVSGIRPEDLSPENGAVPFTEAQARVEELLCGRIVVGHALRHDFEVLNIRIPEKRRRDTALYDGFRNVNSKAKPSLRTLCEKILGVSIQDGEHDSVVDARAAMYVYRSVQCAWEEALAGKPREKMLKRLMRHRKQESKLATEISSLDQRISEREAEGSDTSILRSKLSACVATLSTLTDQKIPALEERLAAFDANTTQESDNVEGPGEGQSVESQPIQPRREGQRTEARGEVGEAVSKGVENVLSEVAVLGTLKEVRTTAVASKRDHPMAEEIAPKNANPPSSTAASEGTHAGRHGKKAARETVDSGCGVEGENSVAAGAAAEEPADAKRRNRNRRRPKPKVEDAGRSNPTAARRGRAGDDGTQSSKNGVAEGAAQPVSHRAKNQRKQKKRPRDNKAE